MLFSNKNFSYFVLENLLFLSLKVFSFFNFLASTSSETKIFNSLISISILSSTIGYIQPKEVETWWVSNFAKNRNLQILCKRDSENIDLEELKNDLIFDDKKSLQTQISKLESANFDELMIAYRRPEDLDYILQTIKDCT